MSGKRVLALYGALLFCFAAVVCRLYWLCSDTAYGARAAAQSVVTLHLPARRGNFYDYRGQLLTGQTTRWMALCVPGEGSYARLFAYTDAAGQATLYQKRNAASPFLLEVDRDVSALGVSCWGISMARAMVLPVWKPPLTNCSPAAGRGIPCSAPSTPRESCGPSPSSPPPTAGPWGCS